jgi:hypothetical protein
MNLWIPLIPSFLDELVRRDGPGSQLLDAPCVSCAQSPALFRCLECFSSPLLCQACMLDAHLQAPFHRVQVSIPSHLSISSTSHFPLLFLL